MTKTKKINVALVDDHLLFREGFRDLLADQEDINITAEGGDGREALALVAKNKPDILLIDLRMPNLGGAPAIRAIKESHPDVKIIVVSMYEDEDYKKQAFSAGADAYHSKMDPAQAVIKTIRALAKGKTVVDPEYLKKISSQPFEERVSESSLLTSTEHELLEELCKGCDNKELASAFAMSEQTVKNHLSMIFRKLRVKNRLEAVRKALDKKWISLV